MIVLVNSYFILQISHANLQYEIRIYQKSIIKSKWQFMFGSIFYASDVIKVKAYILWIWPKNHLRLNQESTALLLLNKIYRPHC